MNASRRWHGVAAVFAFATLTQAPWNVGQVAAQQRDATGASSNDMSCSSLADGRGGKVQGRGAPDSVGTSFRNKCAERARRAGHAPGKAQPQARERSLAVAGLQVDAAWVRDSEAPRDAGPDAARLSATVITSGVVIWLLQSSVLASLLILGLPLWRHVDLLPIVERAAAVDAQATPGPADVREERAIAGVLGSRDDAQPIAGRRD